MSSTDIVLPSNDENLIVGLTTLNWGILIASALFLVFNQYLKDFIPILYFLIFAVVFFISMTIEKTTNPTIKAYIISVLLVIAIYSTYRFVPSILPTTKTSRSLSPRKHR